MNCFPLRLWKFVGLGKKYKQRISGKLTYSNTTTERTASYYSEQLSIDI